MKYQTTPKAIRSESDLAWERFGAAVKDRNLEKQKEIARAWLLMSLQSTQSRKNRSKFSAYRK